MQGRKASTEGKNRKMGSGFIRESQVESQKRVFLRLDKSDYRIRRGRGSG